MKVIHLIVTLDPAKGGPPAVATRLAAAQAQHGHQVSIISYTVPGRGREVHEMLGAAPGMSGVAVVEVDGAGRIEPLFAPRVRGILRESFDANAFLHMHGVWEPMLLAGAREARRAGVPYAITPHGMLDPWSLSQGRLKKRIALALAYRRMINGAAFLHALNEDEARLLGPLRLKPPVRVVPNGVFIEELEPLPPAGQFHREHPELRGRPFVLFLSRLHYKKGLDYLAGAFAKLAARVQDVQLVVAGPDGGERGPFEKLIRDAGLQDRVHLVGPIYGHSKFAALVDASCFCLPSRQEGFSIAITEALACGVPVVISEGCHFPEVAEVGAGKVVALDVRTLADALERVMVDESLRRRMGNAGRELVQSRFTWPTIAARMIDAYQTSRCPDVQMSK